MPKFKVGDVVRIKGSHYVGELGIIREIVDASIAIFFPYQVQLMSDLDSTIPLADEEMEQVNET